MRFNDKELVHVSLGEADLEGRLNYRKTPSGNFSQSGGVFKERWFKLKCNLLFYFKINEFGQIDKQPAGVFVLENGHVQMEHCTGIPFAFSITFSDDPEKKHIFSARTEDTVNQWVSAVKKATYEYWRSRLILLQKKINGITGKDPLLMYPRNMGTVRDVEPSSTDSKQQSFQSHLLAPLLSQPPPPPPTQFVREAKLIDL